MKIMKKTVFLLALILPVCALVAQLPAPVIPLDGNLSAVVQMGDDNSYTLTQDGTRNFAEVYTTGDKNAESFVDQDGAWNTSTVIQDGDKNWVDVTQTNEVAESAADLNFSYISQTGDKNDATVHQQHLGSPPPAHIRPLVAYTFQPGTGNSSEQVQNGNIDLAIVYQEGTNGVAVQKQGMNGYESNEAYASLAIIGQLSSANKSEAEQLQEGAWNVAGIIQGSDKSHARQLQVSEEVDHLSSPMEIPNAAGIIQMEGAAGHKGNEAYQVQYFDNTTPYGNWAGAYQEGGKNYSMQVQVGGNNASGVVQVGNGNHSDVTQTTGGSTMPFANPFITP
jgi:hypothetical protein